MWGKCWVGTVGLWSETNTPAVSQDGIMECNVAFLLMDGRVGGRIESTPSEERCGRLKVWGGL